MEISADTSHQNNATPTTHPQYRQIALIIYIGVLIIGIFDYLTGRPPISIINVPTGGGLLIFCITLVLLPILELRRKSTDKTILSGTHLILIMLLSGLALATARHHYAQLLLLTAILFAELTFSRWVSITTSLIAFALLVIRGALDQNGEFISVFSVFDIQALLIFAVLTMLIWLMARLIKNEWSNRRRLQALHDELKETSAQLAQMAVIDERNRMARDIHDSVGHHLAAVSIQLEMAAKLYEPDPEASRLAISEAQAATHDALQDVRKSVGALRNNDAAFNLHPAVELIVKRIGNDTLEINYQFDGNETLYPQPIRLVMLRAIQEGLTNIYKHATAAHVNLWLQFLPQQARLRIVDDGSGFDTSTQTNGTGLQGLKERVEALGGTLSIESRQDEGTVLDIVLPQTTQ